MKMFRFKAMTQRKYILKATASAESIDEARKLIYNHIIDNQQRYGYNPKLYIKIEIEEIKEA